MSYSAIWGDKIMENFDLWYFLLYVVPEAIVIYTVILKKLNLPLNIKKILIASIITGTGTFLLRYFFLGYHSFGVIILYFFFVNFYLKINNYVKSLTSVLLALIVIFSVGEVFIMFYDLIIPNFSMVYLINAPLLTRLAISYSILITFLIVYKFMPMLFIKRSD